MKRPTYRIWDKKLKKWYEPVYRAFEGKLDDLTLSTDGRLSRRTINGTQDESMFPNRYEVILDKEKRGDTMKNVLRWIVLVWTVCAIPGTLTNDVSTLFFGLLFEGLIIGLMISDLTKKR